MTTKLLQQAVDALQFNNISLFASQCSIADQYLPAYDPATSALQVQFRHLVSKREQVDITDDEENIIRIVRFHVDFGARLIVPLGSDEAEQKALIEATFIAEYELKQDDLTEEAITEFALKNVMFNVWPYWREYLTSTCDRMNLPKIQLPFCDVLPPLSR